MVVAIMDNLERFNKTHENLSQNDKGPQITNQPDTTDIQICIRASKNVFGLIDHFFMKIDNFEYHPGFYKSGNILPSGTSNGLHVIETRQVCRLCLIKLILDFKMHEDRRISTWYPFLNCESLTTGISVQSLVLISSLPVIIALIILKRFICLLFFVMLMLIILLLYSKYLYSRSKYSKCPHLLHAEKMVLKTD